MNFIPFNADSDIEAAINNIDQPIPFVIESGDVNFCGQVLDGIFGYRRGINTPRLREILYDFKAYESSYGRTPLVFLRSGLTLPKACMSENSQSFKEKWVVHSTDKEAGESILKCGCLFSWTYLQMAKMSFRTFGRTTLGEPLDYFNLIDFASVDAYAPECIVASKQHRKFCTKSTLYTPGIRFYIKVSSLCALPGYTPFLGHIRVREVVHLDAVQYHKITPADLGEEFQWTPQSFTDRANEKFQEWLVDRRFKSQ